jgi:hypothetical protein
MGIADRLKVLNRTLYDHPEVYVSEHIWTHAVAARAIGYIVETEGLTVKVGRECTGIIVGGS